MLPAQFVALSVAIELASGVQYVRAMQQGKAQPNRISTLLWGVLPMIIFAAQKAQHVQSVSLISFMVGLTPLVIFFLSLSNKKAYWKTVGFDYVCMGLSFIGIIAWIFTKNPNVAILLTIVADFAAGLPTWIKSYKHPESESWHAFFIAGIAAVIGILVVQQWTFQNYAFVVYLVISDWGIAALASGMPAKLGLKRRKYGTQ